jgi:hypothetical protein
MPPAAFADEAGLGDAAMADAAAGAGAAAEAAAAADALAAGAAFFPDPAALFCASALPTARAGTSNPSHNVLFQRIMNPLWRRPFAVPSDFTRDYACSPERDAVYAAASPKRNPHGLGLARSRLSGSLAPFLPR